MSMTLFEEFRQEGLKEGRKEGLKEGSLQGQRQLLQRLLEKQFGPLPPKVQEHLQSFSEERLTEIGLALFRAQSLQELGFPD
jgi:hypothetical protein